MSLINEALKKAQKDAGGGQNQPPPFSGGGHAHSGGHAGGGGHPLMWIVIGVVLVGLLGWGILATVLFFNKQPAVPEANPSVAVTETQEPSIENVAEVPVEEVVQSADEGASTVAQAEVATPASQPTVQPAPQTQTQEASTPAAQTTTPVVASQSQPRETPAPTQTTAASPQATTPSLDLSVQYTPQNQDPDPKPEIVKAVFQLKIAAVMGRGGSTRIMVDGRVFRSGEIVDYDLMYKFIGKKGSLLFFMDEDGVTYEKRI